MTDDPLASAPTSPPSGQRRRAVAPRPDLRLCLLEAIERRDAAQARLLGQRWVHRRGLVSLEAFQRITLRNVEGDGACRWLEEQLGLESPLDSPPASAAGESLAAAPEEPLAPQPSFHPTASILAALAEPVVPAATPTGSRRWLPRLRFPAPARRPAPSPADLADLRAWLPDADDDLPRAC